MTPETRKASTQMDFAFLCVAGCLALPERDVTETPSFMEFKELKVFWAVEIGPLGHNWKETNPMWFAEVIGAFVKICLERFKQRKSACLEESYLYLHF